MEGDAEGCAPTRTSREFYLGLSSAGRKSFKDVSTTAAASAGCRRPPGGASGLRGRRPGWPAVRRPPPPPGVRALTCGAAKGAHTPAFLLARPTYFATLLQCGALRKSGEPMSLLRPSKPAIPKSANRIFLTSWCASWPTPEKFVHYFQLLAGINPSMWRAGALAVATDAQTRPASTCRRSIRRSVASILWPAAALKRVFSSPGPICELQGKGNRPWRMARVFYAAGFRAGDLVVHNCSLLPFSPGAYIFEGGARSSVARFSGGTGQTEQQIQAMVDLRPEGYAGTPSFLKIIVDKADEMGVDISSPRKPRFLAKRSILRCAG